MIDTVVPAIDAGQDTEIVLCQGENGSKIDAVGDQAGTKTRSQSSKLAFFSKWNLPGRPGRRRYTAASFPIGERIRGVEGFVCTDIGNFRHGPAWHGYYDTLRLTREQMGREQACQPDGHL